MRRLFPAALGVLWATTAPAQLSTTHAGGGSGFVGPADILPITNCYSARACSAAAAAAHVAAMTVQRTSDNATQVLNVLSSGDLDVATATTFCNATTCKVSAWNEQITGNSLCSMIQATQALQPVLSFNFTGTKPSLLFSSANTTSLSTVNATCFGSVQPNNFAVVTQVTSFPATPQNGEYYFAGSGPSPTYVGLGNPGTTAFAYAGSSALGPAVSTGVKHDIGYVFNGSSSIIALDGSLTTGLVVGTNFLGQQPFYLGNLGALASIDGQMPEIVMYLNNGGGTAWTPTQLAVICNNQRLYWGTTGSC